MSKQLRRPHPSHLFQVTMGFFPVQLVRSTRPAIFARTPSECCLLPRPAQVYPPKSPPACHPFHLPFMILLYRWDVHALRDASWISKLHIISSTLSFGNAGCRRIEKNSRPFWPLCTYLQPASLTWLRSFSAISSGCHLEIQSANTKKLETILAIVYSSPAGLAHVTAQLFCDLIRLSSRDTVG